MEIFSSFLVGKPLNILAGRNGVEIDGREVRQYDAKVPCTDLQTVRIGTERFEIVEAIIFGE